MRAVMAILALASVLVCGCTAALERTGPPHGTHAPTVRSLGETVWAVQPGILRLHQTAAFTFRGSTFPMMGLMELDARGNRVRLIAVNELGVKLFDLTVTGRDVTTNQMLPQLAQRGHLAEAVGASLRRIFLRPWPRPDDELVPTAQGYRLSKPWKAGRVGFLFEGNPPRLVEKNAHGAQENWSVRYGDYEAKAGVVWPGRIVLDDRQVGYQLTLRLRDVQRIDE